MLRVALLSLSLAACVAERSNEAIGVAAEIRWISATQVSMSVNNTQDHDICVPSYMWPSPYLSADVFRITDASGRQAPYVGEEPAVMRAVDHRIAAHAREEITVDVSAGYDLNGLAAPIVVQYQAPFRAC